MFAAAVVQHHDATRRDIVDVVADRAGGLARGPVQDGERAAGQAHAVVERLDAKALPGDAEAVHGVAEGGGVEARRPLDSAV